MSYAWLALAHDARIDIYLSSALLGLGIGLAFAGRYPAESGFTAAFTMSAVASLVALVVCFAIPSRDVVRARTRAPEATRA